MAEVLKIDALENGEIFDGRFCGSRKDAPFFAVFGKPIAHSMSPLMQNVALEKIAESDFRYKQSRYFAFEVSPEELPSALEIFAEKNFRGINLTIPLKQTVMKMPFCFDSSAEIAGACNTLKLSGGRWRGFNTDGYGIAKAVESGLSVKIAGADVFLYGAGGAARAIAFKMVEKGCRKLSILNRTVGHADSLASDIKRATGFKCGVLSADSVPDYSDKTIIINATSVGLEPKDSPICDFSRVPKSAVFFDAPYMRRAETASVRAARAAGIKAENGLAMLAWQGAKSLSIWTGKPLLGDLMLSTLKTDFYGNNGSV